MTGDRAVGEVRRAVRAGVLLAISLLVPPAVMLFLGLSPLVIAPPDAAAAPGDALLAFLSDTGILFFWVVWALWAVYAGRAFWRIFRRRGVRR